MFEIPADKSEQIDKWIDELEKKFDPTKTKQRPCGAIGGSLTYMFTPTTLGMIIKIKDNLSGEILDITNYEDW